MKEEKFNKNIVDLVNNALVKASKPIKTIYNNPRKLWLRSGAVEYKLDGIDEPYLNDGSQRIRYVDSLIIEDRLHKVFLEVCSMAAVEPSYRLLGIYCLAGDMIRQLIRARNRRTISTNLRIRGIIDTEKSGITQKLSIQEKSFNIDNWIITAYHKDQADPVKFYQSMMNPFRDSLPQEVADRFKEGKDDYLFFFVDTTTGHTQIMNMPEYMIYAVTC